MAAIGADLVPRRAAEPRSLEPVERLGSADGQDNIEVDE
jgi:hypothetical protein